MISKTIDRRLLTVDPVESPLRETTGVLNLTNYFLVIAGLTGLTLFVKWMSVETNLRLDDLMLFLLGGFTVYFWVPTVQKAKFYSFLSLVCLFFLIGWQAGAFVLGSMLLFIAVVGLSVNWWAKAGLSALLFFFLAALMIWPAAPLALGLGGQIAGLLLMFRGILFLYEDKHTQVSSNFWTKLNYFLLLPNYFFFLFPIVDYKTFVRGYRPELNVKLVFRGLRWILLGLLQFVLYRVLYTFALPAANEVTDLYSLLHYLIISYTLILRLSAIFNFSAGAICLFGYDLPPTFNYLFLAHSFSDLWKRINVYWRAFMMKIFYYPIYFSFKRRGTLVVVLTIATVFFFDWFLHAYQWFWIKGNFLLQLNDILFWAILGCCMLADTLTAKYTTRKGKPYGTFSASRSFIKSLKIIGMLLTMSLLWCFWISPGIGPWWTFMTSISSPKITDWLVILGFTGLTAALGTVIFYFLHVVGWERRGDSFLGSKRLFFFVLATLLLLSNPLAESELTNRFPVLSSGFFEGVLNQQDKELVFQGYYDQLIVSNNYVLSHLDNHLARTEPKTNTLNATGIIVRNAFPLGKTLLPDQDIIFKNARLQTNGQGLRDLQYSLAKPSGTTRIALLGGSLEMGSGVNNQEVFEHVAEQEFNALNVDAKNLEILNFAVSGSHLPQHVATTENLLPAYSPDIVIYTAHFNEIERAARVTGRSLGKYPSDLSSYPYLRDTINGVPLSEDMTEGEFTRVMRPYAHGIYHWGLKRIAEQARRMGALPVYLYLEVPGDEANPEERAELLRSARDEGFHTIDAGNIYGDLEPEKLHITATDRHPNAKGHRLIARRLLDILDKDEVIHPLLFINECQ